MKGRLQKSNKGWVVLYTKCHPAIMVKEFNSSLPLHPDPIPQYLIGEVIDNGFAKVEFEIVKNYIDEHTNQIQSYAKLINTSKLDLNKLESKLDDVLSNETTTSLTGWMNNKRKDDVDNNLFYYKQVMNPYPSESQSYNSYEKGFVEGYNKAKESTCKEEQVIDFTNWLAKFWMSIWVEDRFLWEYQEEIKSNHPYFGYKTSEQLFNLYKYRNHEI